MQALLPEGDPSCFQAEPGHHVRNTTYPRPTLPAQTWESHA